MYRSPLVPPTFEVPLGMEGDGFRLRPLDYEVMLQDYEAVVIGAASIAKAYRREEVYYRQFTLQDEVIELGWHMGEWRRRKSFAYAIMSADGKRCLGSVYLYPTFKRGYDAMGVMWTVPDAPPDFDARVYAAVVGWIDGEWPFDKVGYPGRAVDWDEWRALPDH